MPSVNVSEADFETLADAALDAKRAGRDEQAQKLDKVARKINAAITNARNPTRGLGMGAQGRAMKWQDVPSVLFLP